MMTGISVCISVDIIDDNVVELDFENFNLILVAIEPAVTNISLPIKIISIEERNNDGIVAEFYASIAVVTAPISFAQL